MTKLAFIRAARQLNASDIHLSENSPIVYRVDGALQRTNQIMSADQIEELFHSITNDEQKRKFVDAGDVDFAYQDENVRLRINIYKNVRGVAMAIRILQPEIPTFEQLALPTILMQLAEKRQGLVLVTGAAGSGKSTTLAAMVDYINHNQARHIITLEDPIEYLHESDQSLINQREIYRHACGFPQALRAALREDPDVILIGELRDEETIATALTAAETGHLILGTLHTGSAAQAVERIIDMFPAHRQQQIRLQLAATLQAVVAQQLIKRVDMVVGRFPAFEIMLQTPAIQNLIREGRTHQLLQTIKTASLFGMQSMDESLQNLKKRGLIDQNFKI